MKKITLLLTTIISFAAFAQSKTTGTLSLSNSIPITANFTLNNDTSQVILVLTGPSDRWFGLGIGVESGFGMNDGDVVVFTTTTTPNLTDRNFQGTGNPPQDTQDWTTTSNTVNGSIRTLILTRSLTTADTTNDFQMPYATTNSINFGGVRGNMVNNMNVGSHNGTASAGYVTNATFTPLGVEDFSLNSAQVFPNPSNGNFVITSKVNLQDVAVYSQTGALMSTIKANNSTTNEIHLSGLAKGVYLLELKNETDKSWKKIIIE